MRPKVRHENPDASPQEIIKFLNVAWNKEKAEGRKNHWLNPGAVVSDHHIIKKCDICGLMIANLEAHMEAAHQARNDVAVLSDVLEENEDLVLETPVTDLEVESTLDEIVIEDIEELSTNIVVGEIVMVLRKTLHWPAKF